MDASSLLRKSIETLCPTFLLLDQLVASLLNSCHCCHHDHLPHQSQAVISLVIFPVCSVAVVAAVECSFFAPMVKFCDIVQIPGRVVVSMTGVVLSPLDMHIVVVHVVGTETERESGWHWELIDIDIGVLVLGCYNCNCNCNCCCLHVNC